MGYTSVDDNTCISSFV